MRKKGRRGKPGDKEAKESKQNKFRHEEITEGGGELKY